MPWNEPGGNNKDPWGKRPRDSGPPDLDELFGKLQRRLKGLFGGRGGDGAGGGDGGSAGQGGMLAIYVVIGVLLAGWLVSGFYIVNDGERGLVLRFGAYVDTTGPGPHWHIPYPIESVETVDVSRVRVADYQASMLTEDMNIVDLAVAVQYTVGDAANYAFEVLNPDVALQQALQSALRQVIGTSEIDYILGAGQDEIAGRTQDVIQEILDRYQAGLNVRSVNIQQVQPPDEVQAAYQDAIKAEEDQERYVNEAQAYANGVIPIARGDAARVIEEAKAYQERVVARATGDASRFTQLLVEYEEAPAITRERLYLESMESVLSQSNKVLLDTESGNNVIYLPLDRMMRSRGARTIQPDEPQFMSPDAGANTMNGQSDLRESRSVRTPRESR